MKPSRYVAHPWHGLPVGAEPPRRVTAFIEIVPFDTVKYEVDKASGHMKIDRPQIYSSLCPALYGFIPRTYCDDRVAALARQSGRQVDRGDHDPLDICVLTERPVAHSGFLVSARPVGGLRLLDRGEADDKIIAVLEGDPVFESARNLSDLPAGLVDRLRHYFLTYKEIPHEHPERRIEISDVYDSAGAHQVILESMKDYQDSYPETADPDS